MLPHPLKSASKFESKITDRTDEQNNKNKTRIEKKLIFSWRWGHSYLSPTQLVASTYSDPAAISE